MAEPAGAAAFAPPSAAELDPPTLGVEPSTSSTLPATDRTDFPSHTASATTTTRAMSGSPMTTNRWRLAPSSSMSISPVGGPP